MEIQLDSKVKKNPVIIEGFPGLGLVSTIATEFIIDHLNAKQIGKITGKEVPAIAAIHKGQVIEPFGIFYAEKENILILRGIFPVRGGVETDLTAAIGELAKTLHADEIISLEGLNASITKEPKAFYFSKNKNTETKFKSIKVGKMDEGIVLGLTAILLTKMPQTTFIFAETQSEMPDSRAAAKIIEVLDKYLGLDIDYKPLLKKAEQLENQVKDMLIKSMNAVKNKEQKESYVG